MSNLTRAMMMGAAGASGDKTYVDDVFSTFLFEGSGSAVTITNGLDLSGEGGMIWIKSRTSTASHATSSSANNYYGIMTPNTNAADADSTTQYVRGTSTGFEVTMGNITPNDAGEDMASWSFRKAPGFFDCVAYTGTGSNRTIAHSLGSVPGMIIVKRTSGATGNWKVWHRSLPNTAIDFLTLNETGVIESAANHWNSTAPTSTHFSLGTNANVNDDGSAYVAYIFAHDDQSFGTSGNESIIKCGSYTGNGSSTGPVIDLGFEPQWWMIKRTDAVDTWGMYDSMRGAQDVLRADSTSTEVSTASFKIDLLANGFQPTSNDNGVNASGGTYVYMAIRRPNKPPTAATEVFAVDYGNSSSTIPCWDSGFPVDFAFWTYWDREYAKQALSRLTGTKYLYASGSNAEANDPDLTWDSNLGWGKTWNTNTISWMFKRAPGFMDVVAYTGTGSARTVSHNLEAIPELVIIKARTDAGENWAVYNSFIGNTKGLNLNRDKPAETTHARWNSTSPTSTQFTVDSQNSVNYNTGTYVAYLFATLSGISKVGNYTGTGNDINVDCGFSSGARFVLIKRTDSDADWFLFDTLRGIAVGNDPYLLLNMAAIQVTNTDYIDPLNAGFTVTSSAPAALNTSGGTYIFLAIA